MGICNPLISSGAVCAPVILASREYPNATLALSRRIDGQEKLRRPAAWWKERSEAMHLDSVYFNGVYGPWTVILAVF
eukprot:COSAG01_NODE_14612_length_1432_cov_2.130533_2_plen_76_part_01